MNARNGEGPLASANNNNDPAEMGEFLPAAYSDGVCDPLSVEQVEAALHQIAEGVFSEGHIESLTSQSVDSYIAATSNPPSWLLDSIPYDIYCGLSDESMRRLFEASSSSAAASSDLMFLPGFINQTGFPIRPKLTKRRKELAAKQPSLLPGRTAVEFEGDRFVRQIKDNGVLMVEFTCTSSDHELASGIPARALLAYISTRAIQTKNRQVNLGRHVKYLITEELQAPYTKGNRGTSTSFPRELRNLCHLHVDIRGAYKRDDSAEDVPPLEVGSKMDIIKDYCVWGDGQKSASDSAWVLLTKDYFDYIQEHAVPFTKSALAALVELGDALAFDLYQWACYRQNHMRQTRKRQTYISWSQAQKQFAPHLDNLSDFKHAAKAAIAHLNEKGLITAVFATKAGLALGPGRQLETSPSRTELL